MGPKVDRQALVLNGLLHQRDNDNNNSHDQKNLAYGYGMDTITNGIHRVLKRAMLRDHTDVRGRVRRKHTWMNKIKRIEQRRERQGQLKKKLRFEWAQENTVIIVCLLSCH